MPPHPTSGRGTPPKYEDNQPSGLRFFVQQATHWPVPELTSNQVGGSECWGQVRPHPRKCWWGRGLKHSVSPPCSFPSPLTLPSQEINQDTTTQDRLKFILGKTNLPYPTVQARFPKGPCPAQWSSSCPAPASTSVRYDAATWVRGSSRYWTKAWACERGKRKRPTHGMP